MFTTGGRSLHGRTSIGENLPRGPVMVPREMVRERRVDRMNPESPSARAQSRPLALGWDTPDGRVRLFLVERQLPATTERSLAILQDALMEASRRFAARSELLVYLGSTFVPRQERLLSLFAGGSLDLVRAANEAALAPFISIEPVDLPTRANRRRSNLTLP